MARESLTVLDPNRLYAGDHVVLRGSEGRRSVDIRIGIVAIRDEAALGWMNMSVLFSTQPGAIGIGVRLPLDQALELGDFSLQVTRHRLPQYCPGEEIIRSNALTAFDRLQAEDWGELPGHAEEMFLETPGMRTVELGPNNPYL